MYWQLELILFVFLLVAAMIALEADNLLIAVVMLTNFSFIMALLFTAMGAVDVGFTEAVVGAGVTGVFFIVVLFQTTDQTNE